MYANQMWIQILKPNFENSNFFKIPNYNRPMPLDIPLNLKPQKIRNGAVAKEAHSKTYCSTTDRYELIQVLKYFTYAWPKLCWCDRLFRREK